MPAPFAYTGLPTRVVFGPGRAAEVTDEVRRLGMRRALVLSTRGHRALAESVAARLGELGGGIYANAAMHTPVDVTEDALAQFRAQGCDGTVAVGGGSTTGLGKAIALRTDCPQLVLPTTYAGSEVTTMLGETRDGVKQTQRSPKILPEAVIYDVELTLTLPPAVSATSGVNAIAHAAEALYAFDVNPVVALLAEEGIGALARSLPRVVAAGDDVEARGEALYGAWLCGLCLASATMGLHHKLCHVLGGAFDLPHADTHAVLLPHALDYNAPAAPQAMARIARALGADDGPGGLRALLARLPVPRTLAEIGMPREGLDRAVELVMRDSYPNPRPLERGPVRAMLERALGR
jgi:alcohol dehydrogenase class IV